MLRLYVVVFLSGASLMGLEIVGSRILAPVFGTSIFVWGALITTFLASLSAGYALGGAIADRRPSPSLLGRILGLSGVLLWLVLLRPDPLLALCARAPVPDRFQALLAALLLFGVPSVLMGAVTPFATRLAAREIGSIGRTAGNLAAVSTAGSIAGTFGMAFILIPALSLPPILFGLGATLVVAAALCTLEKLPLRMLAAALLVAAGAGLYLVTPSEAEVPVPDGKIVYQKETAYHRLRVVDWGIQRGLYFDNRLQGWVNRAPGGVDRATYRDGILASLLFRKEPLKSAVVIGLGAGMVPTYLSEKLPSVETTSIEIDPEVVRTAEKYFDFRPDGNDRVVVGDGRSVLARERTPADLICLDAYFSDSIPFHLVTQEFFELCRDRLTPDGVFVGNLVGIMMGKDDVLFWSTYRTLARVFPRVYVLSPELAAGRKTFISNTMLIATRSPERLSRDRVLAEGERLARELGRPQIATWAAALYDGEVLVPDAPILTDAYSPTDALQHLASPR